jgi:hypothetical protein
MDGVIIQIFKEWFLELYGVCEKWLYQICL